MRKRDELTDPTSCLNKAKPDEPLFVLKATDPLAPMAIRHWITMADTAYDKAKLEDAESCAAAMERWHNQNCPGELAADEGEG
tara:strand:+ start:2178 stop:2426 length:249 start_codon:yes stop_codon:yes gene_type:complete